MDLIISYPHACTRRVVGVVIAVGHMFIVVTGMLSACSGCGTYQQQA